MTVHCLELVTATNYPARDARADLATYRSSHNEALSAQSVALSSRTTASDGSGVEHYHARFRFAWSEDVATLRNDAESWLTANFDWWAWRYHACSHDEDRRSGCTWDAQNTSGNVPQEVIDRYI